MKSYSAIIAMLIAVLVGLALLMNQRAQLVWQTLLGNTHVKQGQAPKPSAQTYAYQFTPLGVIVVGWLAIRYGKGGFGLALAYILGALLLVTLLVYWQRILPLFATAAKPKSTNKTTGG